METRIVMQRDTPAWALQTWAAFGLAVTASAVGVWNLPHAALDRAFVAIGFFFCLFTTLAVSKTVRDNRDGRVDTAGWIFAVWTAFASAIALTAWGLWRMAIEDWQRGFLIVSWLFLVSSAFTVAKTLRDQHEAELLDADATPVLPLAGDDRALGR
jgi:hypothetical protein